MLADDFLYDGRKKARAFFKNNKSANKNHNAFIFAPAKNHGKIYISTLSKLF